MISPVLRTGGRLLGALRAALAQPGWENGWPPREAFPAAAPPGGEHPPAKNGCSVLQSLEAPLPEVHNEDADDPSPPPKVIPGSFGQEKDEDGYQRGNWRREPFATLIVAARDKGGSDGPCGGDPDAEAPSGAHLEAEAPPAVEDAGEAAVTAPEADLVDVPGAEAGTAPDAPESEAPAPPAARAAARPVRRIPAPPSIGTRGSWERDRQPWFTGRWGSQAEGGRTAPGAASGLTGS